MFLIARLEGRAFDFDTITYNLGQFNKGDNSLDWDWRKISKLRFWGQGEEGQIEIETKEKKMKESKPPLIGLEDFEKPKGHTFGEVQEHLLKGGCVRRSVWNESPHKAFYAKQIDSIIIVDSNNIVLMSGILECQVMATDWEIIDASKKSNS